MTTDLLPTTTTAELIGVALMTADEARATVERVRRGLDAMRRDLLDLYEREGWRALGYSSWRVCTAAEFGSSVATVYRQLEAAEIERDVAGGSQLEKPIPTAQLQAVKELPPAQRAEAFRRADARAGDRPRTAADVAAAAAELAPPIDSDARLLAEIEQLLTKSAGATVPAPECYARAREIRSSVLRTRAFTAIDQALDRSLPPAPSKGAVDTAKPAQQPPASTPPGLLPDGYADAQKRAKGLGLYLDMNARGEFSLTHEATGRAELADGVTDFAVVLARLASRAAWVGAAPALPGAGNVADVARDLIAAHEAGDAAALAAAYAALGDRLYGPRPTRPKAPKSADVSAQTAYTTALERYASALEARLGVQR